MGEVRVEIEIDAPADAVWSVLNDVGRWAEWNEVIIDGRCDAPDVGARISCKVAAGPVWFPVNSHLVEWAPQKTLVWGVDHGRIARVQHGFTMHASGARTRVVHFESFEGLIGRMIFPLINGTLTRNYATFLACLKARVER